MNGEEIDRILARRMREEGDARNERIMKVLAEFDEADSGSLPVYYRVSPQFIADVRDLFQSYAPRPLTPTE